MQAQVSASDIACRRGDRVLFTHLSMALRHGDAAQAVGANGTGKSSLLRILAGLLRPFAGSLQVSGKRGLVDDRLALDGNVPLGHALRFWSKLDGCRDADCLDRLQLNALLDVPVRFLSTGQKKRAALARLAMSDCHVWILDEPLNGLDAQAQTEVEAMIAQHRTTGGIALVASHQPIALPDAQVITLADYAP